MSVCVVAQFPWAAIRNVTKSETRGVVVCSDTQTTIKGRKGNAGICSKQESLANNIFICYTSNNLYATVSGLKKVPNVKNVKNIGNALKEAHKRDGGFTELIVVVSRRYQPAKILELMPPHYKPKHRTGVIGIGDRTVLQSFRENFFDQPRPDLLELPLSPEACRNFEQASGVRYTPPRYRIVDAATNVMAALSEGIGIANSLTVGLPIQVSYIIGGKVRWSKAFTSAASDTKKWKQITLDREDARIPHCGRPTMRSINYNSTAVQLFD